MHVAAVLGVLGVLAAGCGEADDATVAPPGSAQSGSEGQQANVVKPVEGQPKKGGTLRVGLDAESEGFNPADNRMAAAALTISRSIYDPLATVDADMKAAPFLAEKFTPSADFQQWDIKLRPNIKFHNNEALDAAAVSKFMNAYKTNPRVGSGFAPVNTIEVLDPMTVRVTMKMPWSTFPFILTTQPGLIPAPATLDDKSAANKPVGTGPFKLVDWQVDKSLIVEKNTSYWRTGLPYLDKIDFRPISDDQTRYRTFQSGDIDVMITPREASIQSLAKEGKDGTAQVVFAKGDNDVNMLMFNTSKPPFDDIRLRQAVAHAIDRDQLLAIYGSGEELAATSVYKKSSPWYKENNFPKYDPEKAKQLVQQISGGGRIALTVDTVPDVELAKILQVIQQMLSQVGIDISLDQTEQATLINKAITGEYEIMTWRQFGNPDPDGNYTWWISDNATGGAALNMARNKDPEIDAALRAGRATQDDATRKQLYGKIQERLAIDLPYVFYTHLRWTMGAKNNVRNIESGTMPDGSKSAGLISGIMPLNEMWLGT
jgi:peptide/nickel transport system substrate-binding protein